MGKIRQLNYGYEYISNNGIAYDIGENGADFNIIIDTFVDLDEKFDKLAPYNYHLVDYVCGDPEEEETFEWIDERIERYENHERTVRFYDKEPCECYIGLKEEQYKTAKRISKEEFIKLASTIQND